MHTPREQFLVQIALANSTANGSRESVSILQLLWAPKWKRELNIKAYQKHSAQVASEASIGPHQIEAYLPFLNPSAYERFAVRKNGEQMSPTTAQAVFPVILSTIQLRRTFADERKVGGGKRIRIGSEIPPYVIHTVELAMQNTEQKL